MTAAPASPELTGRLLPGPTVDQVLKLQAIKGYPAVSLLLTTTVAPRMTPNDAISLRALATEALARTRKTEQQHTLGTLQAPSIARSTTRSPVRPVLPSPSWSALTTANWCRCRWPFETEPSSIPPLQPAISCVRCTGRRGMWCWCSTPARPGCSRAGPVC